MTSKTHIDLGKVDDKDYLNIKSKADLLEMSLKEFIIFAATNLEIPDSS